VSSIGIVGALIGIGGASIGNGSELEMDDVLPID
jgi:hypothetical protein